jgi:hypothetical protein
MSIEEINKKIEELRKLWPSATSESREILKRRARAYQIILERRKNGR